MTKKYISYLKYLPFYGISLMPMPILYVVSDGLFFLLYYVFKYRRKVVYDNLKHAFPSKSSAEIKKIERNFYRHFCDIIFESIKTLTASKKFVRKHLTLKNPDFLEHYINERKNILLYTAHQGNWEWLIFLPIFFPYQANTFYKPLKNKYFDGLAKRIRERFGVHCVPSEKGYRTLIGLKDSKDPVLNCIIGDQSPTKTSTKYWFEFLNRETAFFTGAEKIAKKTDPVVVFPYFKKWKRGYYELQFQLIDEKPSLVKNKELVYKYASTLENAISSSPELWLWSHRRWKLQLTGDVI
ncbi:lysophospholipid acyltransferase family protein [Arenibacter sp. GZD96]|uniref:lysophospholipid acyltransferase family protein n=1 Tax=Aurantibrevibacter litoralis TaxID=3106030 RepID=UPI002AFDE1AB|nr:lysophospholipid acyltransferase family protein [Arenibacter sp. GZD-96]MEA1785197.1 lysophospholipid acyltransferase family protein [Arenibacter sp. GZD-96]